MLLSRDLNDQVLQLFGELRDLEATVRCVSMSREETQHKLGALEADRLALGPMMEDIGSLRTALNTMNT